MKEIENKCCWECKFQCLNNLEFLGKCLYFLKFKKPPKPIPSNVVDVGCKHFSQVDRHPLRKEVINKFRRQNA
jgi:hypothetical protein